MVSKTKIKENLGRIDRKYRRSRNNKEAEMYSKMAIMELSGWVEETIDDIVIKIVNRKIKNRAYKDYIEKNIVKPNYGFAYEKHFFRMMISIIGIINYEKLECKFDQQLYNAMKTELNNLYSKRNTEAHTYLSRLRNINAPSITKRQFEIIYSGLKNIEKVLKENKL